MYNGRVVGSRRAYMIYRMVSFSMTLNNFNNNFNNLVNPDFKGPPYSTLNVEETKQDRQWLGYYRPIIGLQSDVAYWIVPSPPVVGPIFERLEGVLDNAERDLSAIAKFLLLLVLTLVSFDQERVGRLVTELSLLPYPVLGIGCRPTWNSCVRLLHSIANWRVFCFILLTPGTLCELWNAPSVCL